ncbi:MarR family winged helix-turn-helix transcriptional regulator [Gorillibacterium sp. sgz5001074]|uniref:MarR family winged helix-turn-helix transcriptional regulator n=1 Tax=Gorillibacterium sp. sgz5001074 TaxID=3446695 RepID=UPI003F672D7F
MDINRTPHLDVVFKRVAKLHHQTVHKLLSDKEVFPGQPPVLRLLSERDGRSQRELAEEMEITPATLNVMIGRMEKNGLLERKPDPADQRVSRVYLTEKGREAHQELRDVIGTMEATCFGNFTMEERIVFRRLLLQMYDNLKQAGTVGEEPVRPGE